MNQFGILLCSSKNDTVVEITIGDNNNIYTSKYLTYLPTKEELIKEIEIEKSNIESLLDENNKK
jgi:hypothetical protein